MTSASAAAARDAIGAKIAAMSTSVVVFANGSVSSTVGPMSSEAAEGQPMAFVHRGRTVRDHATNYYVREFTAEFVFSALERAGAEQWVDAMDDLLIAAFRTGVASLAANIQECLYVGSDSPLDRREQGRPLWSWTARFETHELDVEDYTA